MSLTKLEDKARSRETSGSVEIGSDNADVRDEPNSVVASNMALHGGKDHFILGALRKTEPFRYKARVAEIGTPVVCYKGSLPHLPFRQTKQLGPHIGKCRNLSRSLCCAMRVAQQRKHG